VLFLALDVPYLRALPTLCRKLLRELARLGVLDKTPVVIGGLDENRDFVEA